MTIVILRIDSRTNEQKSGNYLVVKLKRACNWCLFEDEFQDNYKYKGKKEKPFTTVLMMLMLKLLKMFWTENVDRYWIFEAETKNQYLRI